MHSDASMWMGSPNTKFHWILYNNGRVRTHVQSRSPITTNFESENKFVFELIEFYVFVKKTTCNCNQQKMIKMMSLIDYSLITSAIRLSVFSEIDVNNGCILLYAGVTLVLAMAYLTLVFWETQALNCFTHQQVHVQGHQAWRRHFVCRRYVPLGPKRVRWDSYRGCCSATEDSQSPPQKNLQQYVPYVDGHCRPEIWGVLDDVLGNVDTK